MGTYKPVVHDSLVNNGLGSYDQTLHTTCSHPIATTVFHQKFLFTFFVSDPNLIQTQILK